MGTAVQGNRLQHPLLMACLTNSHESLVTSCPVIAPTHACDPACLLLYHCWPRSSSGHRVGLMLAAVCWMATRPPVTLTMHVERSRGPQQTQGPAAGRRWTRGSARRSGGCVKTGASVRWGGECGRRGRRGVCMGVASVRCGAATGYGLLRGVAGWWTGGRSLLCPVLAVGRVGFAALRVFWRLRRLQGGRGMLGRNLRRVLIAGRSCSPLARGVVVLI